MVPGIKESNGLKCWYWRLVNCQSHPKNCVDSVLGLAKENVDIDYKSMSDLVNHSTWCPDRCKEQKKIIATTCNFSWNLDSGEDVMLCTFVVLLTFNQKILLSRHSWRQIIWVFHNAGWIWKACAVPVSSQGVCCFSFGSCLEFCRAVFDKICGTFLVLSIVLNLIYVGFICESSWFTILLF